MNSDKSIYDYYRWVDAFKQEIIGPGLCLTSAEGVMRQEGEWVRSRYDAGECAADAARSWREKVPDVLYKYRPFDKRTLDLITSGRVWFADPASFNDPLDCYPSVEIDCSGEEMIKATAELALRRTEKELRAAASAIHYEGSHVDDHIKARARYVADGLAEELYWNIREHIDYDDDGDRDRALNTAPIMESELVRRFDRGIFSLAARYDCPLLWSHYADQHRGLCIGYEVPENIKSDVYRVRYGGLRNVKASVIRAMLDGDEAAKAEVDSAVLLSKALGWQYEMEWRMFGPRGLHATPMSIAEIHFGMRCPDIVIKTIDAALFRLGKSVLLTKMRPRDTHFSLVRFSLDPNNLHHSLDSCRKVVR